jgi:ATP-dependent Clp protease adaptor protein ClpS
VLGYNTQHVIFIWGTFMSQSQTQWEVDTFADTKISVPKLYKVILHNDDETSFIFVVLLLMAVFDKSQEHAYEITQEVHESGRGVAGVYTYEIAEQKVDEAFAVILEHNFTLQLSIEED